MTAIINSFLHYAVAPWAIGYAYFSVCAWVTGGPL